MTTASQPSQVANHDMLIERAQGGDSAAFGELYVIYRRRIYAICLRMVRNQADAEDLVQEAFLQLFRKLKTFRGESQFSTWFHRLTVNIALMKLRKKEGFNNVSLDELMETNDGKIERHIASVDHHLRSSPERITVEQAVEQLPPGYRLILVMHDIEGFEHGEIAKILGCSTGNSKSQLHKARAALLGILGVEQGLLSVLANFDKFLSENADEVQ